MSAATPTKIAWKGSTDGVRIGRRTDSCGYIYSTDSIYDDCMSDADWGDNAMCACDNGNTSHPTASASRNRCIPSNCRTDADCGAGSRCLTETATSCDMKITARFCSTPSDLCSPELIGGTGDDECGDYGSQWYCEYSRTEGHWACTESGCYCE